MTVIVTRTAAPPVTEPPVNDWSAYVGCYDIGFAEIAYTVMAQDFRAILTAQQYPV